MKSFSGAPNYLCRNPYSYCFRMKVPKDLQPKLHRKELKYSLKTGRLSEAKQKARYLSGQIQLFYRNVRKGFLMDLSDVQIKLLISKFIKMLREKYDEPSTYDDYRDTTEPFDIRRTDKCLTTEEDFKFYPKILDMEIEGYRRQLSKGEYFEIEEDANKLLLDEGYKESDIDKSSSAYAKLCHGLLRAEIKGIQYHKEVISGKFIDDFEDIISEGFERGTDPEPDGPTPLPETIPAKPPESPKTLSQVRDAYFAEGDAEQRWKDLKSREKPWKCMQVLIDYFNDAEINTINRDMVIQFKKDLWKLPPNMNRVRRLKGKTIHEILTMKHKQTLKESTVSDYMSWTKSLFEYAELTDAIVKNPTKNMVIKKKKRATESRQIFSINDLGKMFSSPDYTKDLLSKSYMFWCPIIALFTGARLNEIAQLHLDDFQQHDNIWSLNINDDGSKKIKNLSSHRIIPLHPFLVDDLGIINHVENLRMAKKKRFFPELSKSRDGYSKNVSRWFNEKFRLSCGITKQSKKVFHSFRHTFATNLAHNDINDHSLKALLGHSEGGVTFEFYVKRGTPSKLHKDLVDHLNFEGLDLSHLKTSKWVVK